MKTEVYSWRLSAELKAELEAEARRDGSSLSALLEEIASRWLVERRNGHTDDDAEQAALRKRVLATVGTSRGGDPTRSSRAVELVREIVTRKHVKESRASRRLVARAH
jgi:hypothetical protein